MVFDDIDFIGVIVVYVPTLLIIYEYIGELANNNCDGILITILDPDFIFRIIL